MTNSRQTYSVWANRNVLVLSPTPTWPLDVGNRRRIFHMCRRIQGLGARIHFLHYPTEEEWAVTLPADSRRHMIETWDNYSESPVTRPLYAPPAHEDHSIDEWWDPAIGDTLNWLFRVQHFDAFIVNYAWLSKAFEHAPSHVVKILDTHDRFSGRRQLFETHGISPQFFYLDEENESVALARADVVWAIKSEEEAQFRRMTDRRVLTLVHAEPVSKNATPPTSGILRFGMAGSCNDINIVNFRRFLHVASEFIVKTLLPCEIVIGGTCCDGLRDLSYPFLRQLGHLDTMDDFYDEIDVVLGPMEFSTGLKIRIGEALSRAKPIVAHRHCFEGYTPTHDFHTLESFEEMMHACREIVRQPDLIGVLEVASFESMNRAQRSVTRTLELSIPESRYAIDGIVFFLDLADLFDGAFPLDHVCEAALYLANQCKVAFYLDGLSETFESQSILRLRKLGRVLVSKSAAALLNRHSRPVGIGPSDVLSREEILKTGALGFWIGSPLSDMPVQSTPISVPVFVHIAVMALRLTDPALVEFMSGLRRTFSEVVAMDNARSKLLAASMHDNTATHLVPSLWCGDFCETLKQIDGRQRTVVTLFVADLTSPAVDLALGIVQRAPLPCIECVYDDRIGGTGGISRRVPDRGLVTFIPVSRYPRHLRMDYTAPKLVIEIGYSSVFVSLCELMDRAAVPRLSLFQFDQVRPVPSGRSFGRFSGLMDSALALTDWLSDEAVLEQAAARGRFRYRALDPGWTIVWDIVKELIAARQGLANTWGGRKVDLEVALYTKQKGDCWFAADGWAGNPKSHDMIEAFGIRPMAVLLQSDIEYKAYSSDGRETPWVSDGALCGTRGNDQSLSGFAVRLAPYLQHRFHITYEGAFAVGGASGVSRNGEPCIASLADDTLEAIQVSLIERMPA